MTSRRIIALLYIVLLTVFGLGAGALFLEARAEYTALKQTETTRRAKLAAAEAQLAAQERVLKRLRNDPKFVEKMVRERLKFVNPEERVFVFPD